MTDRSRTSSGGRTAGAGAPGLSGVVETIAAGFSMALWRPHLLILPVVIDLVLWFGLQVSAQPLTDPLARLMAREGGENGELASDQLLRFGEQAHVNDLVAWLIPSLFAGVPSDSVLTGLLSFLTPPLVDGVNREAMYAQWGEGLVGHWRPDHWITVLGVALAFMAIGSVLLVLFRIPLARAIRESRGGARQVVSDIATAWLRVVGLIALVAIGGTLVFGPVLLVAATLLLFGLNLTALLGLVLILGGGMVAIYTLFAVDAIVLSRVGPVRGIRQSFEVVRANFGQTVRFVMSSLLIATGSFQLWQALVANPPGIVISLLGNAFVGTGLILASMMFFQDRFRLLQRDVPQVGR